jgi:diguanylate cyclase (GGDEF)-like protein
MQKAYECVHARSLESRWVSIPTSVMLPAHATIEGQRASTYQVMETVLRQRTCQLQNYKQELDLANARLLRIAETDSVTGLLNRRRFDELVDEAVAGYNDGDSPVALLVLALDDAEGIAGLFGQRATEQAVQAVAAAIGAACRPDDILGRTGPAEFGLLLPQTPLALAQAVSDRIIESVSDARMAADPDLVFSVSVGLVWTPVHGRTGSELRSAALALPGKIEHFEELRKAG